LQLAELQGKVRTEVSSEYWLNVNCAYPDKQLFDWGMMRLRRPPYGIGDPFAMDADDQIRKKRDAEVIFYFTDQCPSPPLGLNPVFHIMDIIGYSLHILMMRLRFIDPRNK
jgi:hypothetical protein